MEPVALRKPISVAISVGVGKGNEKYQSGYYFVQIDRWYFFPPSIFEVFLLDVWQRARWEIDGVVSISFHKTRISAKRNHHKLE